MVEKEICKCGHKRNDHSYNYPDVEDDRLDCDKCDCKDFE